ncbi:response regulator [Roseateles sp. DC23W]|uniref:Response regulator n=1 Tax=Pelomonas dachongensis TaxID=3299029 RepID=A0ABW7EH45_9BURK
MSDSLKFLVVDALPGVQTFARQLLQGHGFHNDQVLCCADTDSALAQGLVFKPGLLITDWFAKSPLTGVQLYQRLHDSLPGLRLALLSFDATPEQQTEARALSAHFLLKKPFTAEQFKAEMVRTLELLRHPVPTRAPRPVTRPVLPPLPPTPVVKPGDKVRYQGAVHVAQHVVHRHGETVVQLKGQTTLVPVEKLQPA